MDGIGDGDVMVGPLTEWMVEREREREMLIYIVRCRHKRTERKGVKGKRRVVSILEGNPKWQKH